MLIAVALLSFGAETVIAAELPSGWLQTRDQNPFALATGLPLAPGIPAAKRWQFDATFNIANTELEQFSGNSSLLFDAETHESRFSAAYAFNDHWSLRGSISHLQISSGFLDGPIERFHRIFGFDNGDRGHLGLQAPTVEVRHDGTVLYALDSSQSGSGPLLIDLTRSWQLAEQGVAGITLGGKFPTGSQSRLSDSGSTDFSISAFTLLALGERLTLGARAGLLYQNDNRLLDNLARSQVPFASLLLRYRLGKKWSAFVQSDAHGALYRDLPDFLGSASNQLNIGFSRRFGERAEFQASLGEDLPALHTTDVVLSFNLRIQPRN
ncbi:MAG TPA: DUF3187 family protein [Dokdonella sp.]|uniref:DUF3187 family protein n=1 Tax=Dokdonella sp. TaxID=2291710 RepID=UPI002D7F55B2|nr:DUF3187 family protein [Dokdonella sp.]HET9031430.1 DUF3187 family protein [Dokdonella sp.]